VAKKITNRSIARYGAATGAAIWAMLGLGNAYGIGLGRGVDAFVVIAVVVNVALIIAAALAFVNASSWPIALTAAALVVTADRVVNVIGTNANALTLVSSVLILFALAALVIMARKS